MIDAKELDDLALEYGDQKALRIIADRHAWALPSPENLTREQYFQPNGLHVTLEWTNNVLTYVERGTRVSALTCQGDTWSGPEMVAIAAMFLSDTE